MEYGLLVAGIAALVIIAVLALGGLVATTFQHLNDQITGPAGSVYTPTDAPTGPPISGVTPSIPVVVTSSSTEPTSCTPTAVPSASLDATPPDGGSLSATQSPCVE